MAYTRASQGSDKTPQSSPPSKTPKKRTATAAPTDVSSPPAKRGRGRPKKEKEQKTIEQTMTGLDDTIEDDSQVAEQINGKAKPDTNKEQTQDTTVENGDKETRNESEDAKPETNDEKGQETTNGLKSGEKNAFGEVKADVSDVKQAAEEEQNAKTDNIAKDNKSIITDNERAAAIPSSILEKGLIYFFFRPRVNIDDPQGLEDVARSYIVLHPLPLGAKLGEGPLEDSGNARLLALPKKMLPKSKQDRFLVFVEKTGQYIKDLRERLAGGEYATKTVGTSTTEPAKPFAEGIYAITSTGRESHLAYHVTVPREIGEVQKELGLFERGTYVVSAKNPQAPGPANATLDNPAKYPDSIQKKFRNLRWMPLEPELLDYEATRFLIIGEGMGDTGRAAEDMSKDKKDDEKEKPSEEMEKLEEEDHERIEGLKEDDPVFADLGLSGKEFEGIATTW